MADRLAVYHRKRNFTKTPEPKGAAPRRRGKELLFVVQKHAARRLHYDFRLELDGVLKSWAVPKGPSLDPHVKRLAVHVEDHPLDYAHFEGVIPEGQYGGGTVLVWDTGTWSPLGENAAEALRRGSLKFELHGKKLRGRWALVRMGGRKREDKNWLLLKEGDAVARPGSDDDIVERQTKSVLSGRDLPAVAKARERVWHSNRADPPPRAAHASSVDASAVPGARRAKLPSTLVPQLATLATTVPAGEDWLHEIKFDGYRMIAHIDHGAVRLLSRNGKDWSHKFPRVVAALGELGLDSAILDGEVVHLLANGVSSFEALKQDLSNEDTSKVVYCLFDLVYLRGYSLAAARLADRKEALRQLLAGIPDDVLRYSEHVVGRGDEFFKSASEHELEGIIAKRADAPYQAGRGTAWLKIKCQARDEFVIIGWTDPGGAREGFGSLLLGYYDGAHRLRFAGAVGTGFDQKMLRALRRRLDRLGRKEPPSAEIAREAPRRAHWVAPELVAELRYSEWTRDGRLRHPAFLGLRDDKSAQEVVIDRENAKTNGAVDPAPSAPTSPVRVRGTAEIAGVAISNADKVLYPKGGFTKLDLAQYYEQIAPRMLAELSGRPLTLVRCPEGYDKNCFYQKHATKAVPAALERLDIPEGRDAGIHLLANDLTGLLSLVQMGVLEIHVWGSTRRALDRPDRVVFDFDPDEGLAWPRVVEAAFTMRHLLGELGLESFAKATGGKGLHVVVPLRPQLDWDEIKAFTKAMAEEMARREPAAYTTTMAKKSRRGRIFIDYLRNQRGATAIAAYSARARPGAPVAAPLSWKEVEDGVRADAFTIATLPSRLAKLARDPWTDLASVKQSVPAALRRKLRAA
jgi:bifunctional non-homologous end joining protein LigD